MHQDATCACCPQKDILPAVTAQLRLSQNLFVPLKDISVWFADIKVYLLTKSFKLHNCLKLSTHTLTMGHPS